MANEAIYVNIDSFNAKEAKLAREMGAMSVVDHMILYAQQCRSCSLNQVQKDDIWDSKNLFKNTIKLAIREYNLDG